MTDIQKPGQQEEDEIFDLTDVTDDELINLTDTVEEEPIALTDVADEEPIDLIDTAEEEPIALTDVADEEPIDLTDTADEEQLHPFLSQLAPSGIRLELGGHKPETFEKADLIVISPGVPHTIKPINMARAKGIPVMGEIELAARFIRKPIIAPADTSDTQMPCDPRAPRTQSVFRTENRCPSCRSAGARDHSYDCEVFRRLPDRRQ